MDASGLADVLEQAMPKGGRPRQLPVRTLILGILLALADDRPAHLKRVHEGLVSLPEADQARLAVRSKLASGSHLLTYRQVERTFSSLVAGVDPRKSETEGAGAEQAPSSDSTKSELLALLANRIVEASIPDEYKSASSSVAVDWTDYSAWSRPVAKDSQVPASDAEASWGRRGAKGPGSRDELFFGYYAQTVTMVKDEGGKEVPELMRRVCLDTASADPVPRMADLIGAMSREGVVIKDVLADSGYAYRVPENWAIPIRTAGAALVEDLHPSDRGPKGTFGGAILANGNLYCPACPTSLLDLGPLGPGARPDELSAHHQRCAELALYKLDRQTRDDKDGYHRVACPASSGKVRCLLKARSMGLGMDRPEILNPPAGELPRCCAQASITVPPDVNAKTRQKHDYPSAAHRRSYARRTGAERGYSTLKDPSSTDCNRGWCRLFGRAKNLVMLACAAAVRNLRILDSFEHRMAELARRLAEGKQPRTRRRRRKFVPEPT